MSFQQPSRARNDLVIPGYSKYNAFTFLDPIVNLHIIHWYIPDVANTEDGADLALGKRKTNPDKAEIPIARISDHTPDTR